VLPVTDAAAGRAAPSGAPQQREALLDFDLDVTGEVPVVQPREQPTFRIGGDELQ
jgi:hypothetical protein